MYLGSETGGPLTAAREVCNKLEDDMERWELAMAAEREAICGEALGLAIGDTLVTESPGQTGSDKNYADECLCLRRQAELPHLRQALPKRWLIGETG